MFLLDVDSVFLELNIRPFLCTEAAFCNGRTRLLLVD